MHIVFLFLFSLMSLPINNVSPTIIGPSYHLVHTSSQIELKDIVSQYVAFNGDINYDIKIDYTNYINARGTYQLVLSAGEYPLVTTKAISIRVIDSPPVFVDNDFTYQKSRFTVISSEQIINQFLMNDKNIPRQNIRIEKDSYTKNESTPGEYAITLSYIINDEYYIEKLKVLVDDNFYYPIEKNASTNYISALIAGILFFFEIVALIKLRLKCNQNNYRKTS